MKKEPDTLCSWDFCKTCIDFRIRTHIPVVNLKSKEGVEPYYRVAHPDWKPSQPRKNKK